MIGQQAADARALLRHLGITRAHIAGHSYGAAIALQWALDAPDEVQSLALLEAPLFEAIPSGPTFWEGVAAVRTDLYERGDKLGATDAFLTGVVGAEYRQVIATSLPPEQLPTDSPVSSPVTSCKGPGCQGEGSDLRGLRMALIITQPFTQQRRSAAIQRRQDNGSN